MNITQLEIENNSGSCVMLIEIVYDYECLERYSLDGGRLPYRIPGQLYLEEVNLLAITGFTKGKKVYDYEHRDLTRGRLAELDAVAFSIVEKSFCDESYIWEEIIKRTT